MAIGAPQSIGFTGSAITFGAVDFLQGVQAADKRFLWVKNGGGVSTSVNVVIPGKTFEQDNPDVVVTIPAGQERLIGPLVPDITDPATGLIGIVVVPQASVTAALVDVPDAPPDLPA